MQVIQYSLKIMLIIFFKIRNNWVEWLLIKKVFKFKMKEKLYFKKYLKEMQQV